MLHFLSSSPWQKKSFAQQLQPRFFLPIKNQCPVGDCRIQYHLYSYYSTDGIMKLCYNLKGFYGLSCCANCIDRILPFRVLVSSSLTLFPFVLAVRGCSCRIQTRAFIVFLCGARGSAVALTPSYYSRLHGSIIRSNRSLCVLDENYSKCLVVINDVLIT